MKINMLPAIALTLCTSFTSAAAANTASAADNCILTELDAVRTTLESVPSIDSFNAKVTYKGEELATLVRMCEEKTGEKSEVLAKARELSVTYGPK